MYSVIKRVLDIICSLILIIIFSPVMIIVAMLIKKDGGPAIFVQNRSGRYNKTFKIYKFRTMSVKNDVHNFKVEDMMTPFGRKLKNSSLDELPQLFNILKGDMSFIGPRPWILDYSMYFTSEQMKRLNVRPGLTGYAQCNGRNNLSIKEKIKLDIFYVNNMSFKLDVKIILKTIESVLKHEGITSSKFLIKKEIDELKNQTKELAI